MLATPPTLEALKRRLRWNGEAPSVRQSNLRRRAPPAPDPVCSDDVYTRRGVHDGTRPERTPLPPLKDTGAPPTGPGIAQHGAHRAASVPMAGYARRRALTVPTPRAVSPSEPPADGTRPLRCAPLRRQALTVRLPYADRTKHGTDTNSGNNPTLVYP